MNNTLKARGIHSTAAVLCQDIFDDHSQRKCYTPRYHCQVVLWWANKKEGIGDDIWENRTWLIWAKHSFDTYSVLSRSVTRRWKQLLVVTLSGKTACLWLKIKSLLLGRELKWLILQVCRRRKKTTRTQKYSVFSIHHGIRYNRNIKSKPHNPRHPPHHFFPQIYCILQLTSTHLPGGATRTSGAPGTWWGRCAARRCLCPRGSWGAEGAARRRPRRGACCAPGDPPPRRWYPVKKKKKIWWDSSLDIKVRRYYL